MLASFKNVSLRMVNCNKPVTPVHEASDGGAPVLVACDFFSGGPCGSTNAENPGVYEFADGHVYIRVKNISNAAKFAVEMAKVRLRSKS